MSNPDSSPDLELVQNDPNLTDGIKEGTPASEEMEGLKLSELLVGKRAEIKTKNTVYNLERREDGYYLSGNLKTCPTPIKVNIVGSLMDGKTFEGYIGLDMRLQYTQPDPGDISKEKTGITSRIKDVVIVND